MKNKYVFIAAFLSFFRQGFCEFGVFMTLERISKVLVYFNAHMHSEIWILSKRLLYITLADEKRQFISRNWR